MDGNRASVVRFFDLVADAWKANDGQRVGALFVEDGSLINPFGRRADGRAAVSAMYTEYFGGLLRGTTTMLELSSVRVIDARHVWADAEQTIVGSDDATVLVVRLAMLLRREDGGWRFVEARPYMLAATEPEITGSQAEPVAVTEAGVVVNESPESTAAAQTPVTPAEIMQLGMGFWGSKTLLSAVELGVFSELASAGGLDGEALRARLGLHPRSATDFFDTLVALGMLQRDDGRYTNTAATDAFLDQAKPTYIGGILEMANARLYGFWGSLTDGLRTGLPQNEAKGGGKTLFEAIYPDPTKLAQFARAMSAVSSDTAQVIAAKFPWQKYRSVIDIGCAEGAVPVQLVQAHEHLTGGGFDLPALAPIFDSYVAGFGLGQRLRFTGGDFFTDPLPPADVLVMGHILHDWDLDEKRLLLHKAYDALPEGGALIVYDAIIDDDRRTNAFGLLMSLNMLIETSGGFDYTGADCRAWMQETGFRDSYVEHLAGPDSMVVGIK